jgi:hypothetical protein
MLKVTAKTALFLKASLLFLSANAMAADLATGTLIARTLNRPLAIYSIDGYRVVRQDTQKTGPRHFRFEVEATAEGNLCGASEAASLITLDRANTDWNARIEESAQTLTLLPVGPAYSGRVGCEDYSKSAKIRIAVEFVSSVGPKETNAFQRSVFHLALPLGSATGASAPASASFTVTDDFESGWTVIRD